MNIEVCYSGQTEKFETIEQALQFGETVKAMRCGFDVWVNDELHQTTIYNAKTGEFTTEIF